MPDVFTKSKRSDVMSRIRSRGNKATELALAGSFRRHKITGWRRHLRLRIMSHVTVAGRASAHVSLSVRPDFVFPRLKLAIFVDGCFWHRCPRHATNPKNNRAFWQRKFAVNLQRDKLVNRTLKRAGWRVLRIWECTLEKHPQSALRRILRAMVAR